MQQNSTNVSCCEPNVNTTANASRKNKHCQQSAADETLVGIQKNSRNSASGVQKPQAIGVLSSASRSSVEFSAFDWRANLSFAPATIVALLIGGSSLASAIFSSPDAAATRSGRVFLDVRADAQLEKIVIGAEASASSSPARRLLRREQIE